MKKILLVLFAVMFFTGCETSNMMNTPTKKVEMFLENYRTLDEKVVEQLDETVDESMEFNDAQREKYKALMKKHYQSLNYDIKDETIDGDTALVTVEIEVKDYSKVMNEADLYLEENKNQFKNEEGNYDKSLFMDYRLEQLSKATETVKYTLELTLTKVDDEWRLDNISDSDQQKINGIYNY